MTRRRPLSPGPLIAFYGDDFTGASASMEATAFAGLETVLFLSPPTPERLRAFEGARVIGIAGVARAQNPEWMETNLPSVLNCWRRPAHRLCTTRFARRLTQRRTLAQSAARSRSHSGGS